MKLVIVESPTKTKSISKYLGGGYQVMATMGHMRDLPKSKIGIEVTEDHQYIPAYEVVKDREDQVKKLRLAARSAEQIILATDPDREGEAIAWHAAALLADKKDAADKFSRVVFHSITKEAILEAMKSPRAIDMDMVDAQQARRILDRLVGYKLSPLLWRKVRRGLSAGRVQSVAVRLVVDREKEILAFKAVEYWQLQVELATKEKGKDKFWVELNRIGGKKAVVGNGETAEKIVTDLKGATYQVVRVVRKERRAYPQPPFKTSTLQQAAANVLGWSSKKTMSVAQKLYEQGDITYHRTDSLNIAGTAIEEIRGFIKAEWGESYLPATPKIYKVLKGAVVAQEAHEGIRPTHFSVGPNSYHGEGSIAGDEEKLYGLVWRRTLACQMEDAVYDTTTVTVTTKTGVAYELQAIGEIEKFDGWRKLYKKDKDVVILPDVAEGEGLDFKQLKSEQKFTQAPARYNDASLVKELEKRGIGRPSTYAPTISTIIDRRYVDREGRRFSPTTIGMAVTEFLVANFPTEMDYKFTAEMESGLDDIAQGKVKWMKMIDKFFGPFEAKIKDAEKNSKRVGVEAEGTGKTCPLCKAGEVVIREGKFGKFYSCNRFPDCKYTARMIEYVEEAKCEKCGARVVVKRTKTGREFYGCEKYPKCTFASWKKPVTAKKEGEEEEKTEEGSEMV